MNRVRRIFRSLFPPPRRPFKPGDVWPLLLFLLLFLGACVTLDVMDILLYSNLWPFVMLVFAPWFWWMHLGGYAGLSRPRAAVALLSRLALLGLFIVLLTEPRAVRTDDRLTLVFAVDRSASIVPQRKDDTLSFVAKAVSVGKPQKDEAGLVVFGRNAAVELPPAVTLPFEGWINVNIDEEGTNIAKALSLAAAMLPADRQGRIVLTSDGAENDGDLTAVLEDLKAKNIAVDVLGINYEYENEVWLERLELPRFVKIGENYEASVILSAVKPGEGKLILKENQKVIHEAPVKFEEGKNRFNIPIYLRTPGFYEYEAVVELPKGMDSTDRNNIAISFLHLKGRGRVRVVVDPAGDERDYTDLARAMRQAERDVEITNAYDFPRNAMALLEDDCIVFVNVPRDAFDEQQLKAAHDAVYDQGSGFIMVGGPNSFAPGGWHQTDIEKVLPVTMDISQKKRLPKGALVIILHTCEFPEGNTWAKRITKQAIKVLGAQDEVGVLDYEIGAQWVFKLTPASKYEELALKVNRAQPGDMPSFVDTMEMGLAGLKASDAAARHMIIISDGDPSPPPPQLLKDFQDARVNVSTVAIFPHGNQTKVMGMIADVTGGRFYDQPNPSQLPAIFIKEAKTIRRVAIQNKTFTPRMENYSQVLKGITAVPDLDGYVLTGAKPRSNVILKGPEEDELDPILSTWRYGAGVTAAFTSDLSVNWGGKWVAWSQYQSFVQQLTTEVSRVGRESHLRIRTFPTEGHGVIFVEDYSPTESFMEVRAQVQLPDGQQQTVALRQTGPRRYEGRFSLAGQGRYQVMAIGVGDGPEQRAHGGFVVPYSQEFLRFRSNPITLAQIAEKTGGRILKGDETAEQVYAPPRVPRQSSQPIADWMLVILACLIPLDIGLRRVQLDWQVIKGWFTFGRVTRDETMGKLLSVKQKVAATMKGEDKPLPPPRTVRPARTISPVPRPAVTIKAQQPAAAAPTSGESDTTTSRLLQAKRRAAERTKGGNEK